MPLTYCTLIGGAPVTGKTSCAAALAAESGVTHIATDNIRDWMKKLVHRDGYPELFMGAGLSVDEYYAQLDTPQKFLDADQRQSDAVRKGVVSLLECYLPWSSAIIEGVAITPQFASQLIRDFPAISFDPFFIYDDNAARIHERLMKRGLWGYTLEYPDHYKTIEAAYVAHYNQFFVEQATTYRFPLRHSREILDRHEPVAGSR